MKASSGFSLRGVSHSRLLGRHLAKELTTDELKQIYGGIRPDIGTSSTVCTGYDGHGHCDEDTEAE